MTEVKPFKPQSEIAKCLHKAGWERPAKQADEDVAVIAGFSGLSKEEKKAFLVQDSSKAFIKALSFYRKELRGFKESPHYVKHTLFPSTPDTGLEKLAFVVAQKARIAAEVHKDIQYKKDEHDKKVAADRILTKVTGKTVVDTYRQKPKEFPNLLDAMYWASFNGTKAPNPTYHDGLVAVLQKPSVPNKVVSHVLHSLSYTGEVSASNIGKLMRSAADEGTSPQRQGIILHSVKGLVARYSQHDKTLMGFIKQNELTTIPVIAAIYKGMKMRQRVASSYETGGMDCGDKTAQRASMDHAYRSAMQPRSEQLTV